MELQAKYKIRMNSLNVSQLTISSMKRDWKIANEFAKHFSSIGKRYATCISEPKLHYKDYLRRIPSSNQNIFLDTTTPTGDWQPYPESTK